MVNNKQKAYLKSLANPLKSLFQIGKDGLSENVIRAVDDALEAHELIKLNVLKTCPDAVMQIALDLASETKSDVIQTMGRVITLYRKNKEKSSITLPRV